ncbi:MAG: phosphotransferase [Rhodospirillales bacterium]|nr:phosphotransferase [Rhodospirillales bacterium]
MRSQPGGTPAIEDARQALVRLGLIDRYDWPTFAPLLGGVASDIWRVDLPDGPVCVKRALGRLRVAQDWIAPVERSANEVAWLKMAGGIVPEAVPRVIAADTETNLFVMEYLDPAVHRLWKFQLRDGVADSATATAVAERIVRVHTATAGDAEIAARFAADAVFYAIRIEPYLVATAGHCENIGWSDEASALRALASTTADTRLALIHGDVSPKNILVGPRGPVFLDAEATTYGDPAFDLAFCLNHLLLKCLWRPTTAGGFLECFDAMATAYLAGVTWEDKARIEARVARLLPGLLLARVDGKSPVEYLVHERDREFVRRVARRFLRQLPQQLNSIRRAWTDELSR